MNWGRMIGKVILSLAIGGVVGALLVGALGFALAGTEGLWNGMVWGVVLGIPAGAFTVGVMDWAYWGEFVKRIGQNRSQK